MVCYGQGDNAEATMYLTVGDDVKVVDLGETGIGTISRLKQKIKSHTADPEKYNGTSLLLNYYCADGYGDQTPEIIFVMEDTASLIRSKGTQHLWRLKDGEWAFYSAAAGVKTATGPTGYAPTP